MEKKERTHEYLCKNILGEYVTGICKGERFCFYADSINKFTDDGIAITDGEKDGWWVFLLWEELECMFDGEAIAVRAEAVYHGVYDGYAIKECRLVRSDENLADIEKERGQGGITERDVEDTLDFLKSKGLLTDSAEGEEAQEGTAEKERPAVWRGSPEVRRDAIIDDMVRNGYQRACEILNGGTKGREGSDIVRECMESVENAFSDMLWGLSSRPVRPSLAIEAHEGKCRLLEVLTRFETAYKEMEGGL